MPLRSTADYFARVVVPAAYALLPESFTSAEASAMLTAIGMQESRFQYRKQVRGPARSFLQFERVGVQGLLDHPASHSHLESVCALLQYDAAAGAIHEAITHNDVLAAVCGRLLLWTLPASLPTREEPAVAWDQYLAAWRPGKPHPDTWHGFYADAWQLLDEHA